MKGKWRWYMMGMALLLMHLPIMGADEDERVFRMFNASNGMADNGAQTIVCTKTGRMLITTIGHVNFYDGSTFTHIDPTKDDAYPLPAYTGHYHLYFDKHHHLWLKDKYIVTCVDLLTERFVSEVQKVFSDIGMKGKVDDMFSDVDCLLWFLSGRTLSCPERQMSVALTRQSPLQDLDVYDNRVLFLFYADGQMEAYDLESGKLMYSMLTVPEDDVLKYSNTGVLCPVGKNYYQIRNGATEAILMRFDVGLRQWKTVLTSPCHLNNMAVKDHELYVASEHGYWVYDMETEDARHISELTLVGGRKMETDINVIAFDMQGGMWVGTEKRGLLYSKPYHSPFHTYDWSQQKALDYGAMLYRMSQAQQVELPRRVNCVYRDSRGWKWVGTYTGLQLYIGEDTIPQVITKSDGLMNDVVHSVVEDDETNIWIATSYGISRLLIQDGKVAHVDSYNHNDNVPTESFVNGLAMKLPDGSIIMQGLDYVVEFNPAAFHWGQIKETKLYPKLVRLMVNGQQVMPGMEMDGKVILNRAITRTREINVAYNQNTLSLTFTGLNYFRPTHTYYRVRVKGIDENWRVLSVYNSNGFVDNGGMLHLPLIGLKPGKYEIELQASMSPDKWPVEPYVWQVSVNEPWWRMTIVYTALGLLALGLMVANFIFYNRNLRLRLRRNNEEGDIVKRIKTFAARCESLDGELLTPRTTSVNSPHGVQYNEFVRIMLELVPYINNHPGHRFSMQELAAMSGVNMSDFYELMSDNLYQNPYGVALLLRIQEVAQLLETTSQSIEEIADHCRFGSCNFLIASFYHYYRMTPLDYRLQLMPR